MIRPVTATASVLLCDNPGHMTLDGTNTWLLQGPGSDEFVVVDPGPDDEAHITRLAAVGRIPLVLVSHRHGDHTEGIDRLVAATGATVRSVGSGFLRGLGGALADGEVIEAAGVRITVMATPGHTSDSLSFVMDDAVLTADTVLGRGTTVIDGEDGNLADYLASLRRLQGLGPHRAARSTVPNSPILQPSSRCTWRTGRNGSDRCATPCAPSARGHHATGGRARLRRRRREVGGRPPNNRCAPSWITCATPSGEERCRRRAR